MAKIEFSVERTNTGYSAYTTADNLAVAVVGATLPELKANMVEALTLHFEGEGRTFTEADLKIVLDLPQFFDFYKVINVSALAARLGMSQSLLAQYIGGQKKPSPKQTARILDGVRAVGRELAEMDFA
ncbi:helix-turn-helix domain-containing protein [Hymenobacter cheonanensis]|uniref:helix-turn-helix domain-containing protein n=1 Tax=Hymenobacter sp. CA2-7 TaxID=3063993 RepID=UPI002713D861|nr:helix-turn-helix transcriptional regulator [Hymenobacter sp. CA2-7]MDO7888193.1 helix-turn-helix transcriptional regulator [Hymenobacter sp. CA2-7]